MQTPEAFVEGAAPTASRGVFGHEPGSWVPVTLFLGFLAITLIQILAFNEGHLVYDMDDPYIGYAVAEEIAKGNYGINPGEPSSPASTILWPFLLAPLLLLPGALWMPLLINVACTGLAVYVIYGSVAAALRDAGAAAWRPLATAAALSSVLLLNLTFVTFAGMEHGPQVLLAVVVAAALVEMARDSGARPSNALVTALVLGPLIRFEAMALTVPALALLWTHGHRRHAIWIAAGTAAPFLAFVAFLTAQGIGPLPSSLLVRSPHVEGGFLPGIRANLLLNFVQREGLLFAVGMIPLLSIPLNRTRPDAERALGGWLIVAALLHFCFGRFGFWGRYEAYLWGVALVTVPYLLRHTLAGWANALGAARAVAVGICLVAVLAHSYAVVTLRTPLASNDIYVEHREMNRLITDFIQAPVGVNDVGYVAFRNDHYVLDLFGLTSHDVRRRRRMAGFDTSWMDELVRQHGVDLVMVYVSPGFLTRFPPTWPVLGHLRAERFKALVPQRTVTLFATRPEAAPELRVKLAAFGEGLPVGMRLDLRPAPDAAESGATEGDMAESGATGGDAAVGEELEDEAMNGSR